MCKEIERTGIPVAHVCSVIPIALMVGSNRIVPGYGITQPLGNADLDSQAEKALRRAILNIALKALQTDLTEQTVFRHPRT
jgi:betaine reductase